MIERESDDLLHEISGKRGSDLYSCAAGRRPLLDALSLV